MGVNSLPKTVTRQRRDCDLNPGPTVPESSTLSTRLPSHPTRLVGWLDDTRAPAVFRLSRPPCCLERRVAASCPPHASTSGLLHCSSGSPRQPGTAGTLCGAVGRTLRSVAAGQAYCCPSHTALFTDIARQHTKI